MRSSEALHTVSAPIETANDFTGLYDASRPKLLRVAALLLGSGAWAEDVVQDCFERFVSSHRNVEAPHAYLRQMVVNECIRVQRRRARETLFSDPPDTLMASDDQSSIELYEALGHLTPRRRAAVILRYVDDQSVIDIAEALNCTPTTASSLIRRALKDLRKQHDDIRK